MRIALLGAVAVALAAGAIPASADPPQSVSSYYLVRQDPRLCPSPRCGGLWVRLVNQRLTRCGDGTRRRECYAAVVHLSPLRLEEREALRLAGLISAGRALVRGTLVPEAAGRIVRVPDAVPAGTGRTLVASQFYVRATR
jgi:hypothetical protein